MSNTPKIVRVGADIGASAALREALKGSTGWIAVLSGSAGTEPRSLARAVKAAERRGAVCAASLRVPEHEKGAPRAVARALARGEIAPVLCGKVFQVEALRVAFARAGEAASGPWGDAVVLMALGNASLVDWPEGAGTEGANLDCRRDWGAFPACREACGAVLPETEREEELFLFELAMARRAVSELNDCTGTNWGDRMSELSHSLSATALFRAVSLDAPERFVSLAFARRPAPSGTVRRIGVVASSLRSGGAERCAALMIGEWARRGYEVVYLGSKPATEFDYPIPREVVRVRLPVRFGERVNALRRALKEHRIDTCVFFDHIWDMTFYDVLTARETGVRTVAMEHNTFAYSFYACMPEYFFPRRAVYAMTDVLTTLSTLDCTMFRSWGARACYMPNPLTFDPATCPRHELAGKTMIFIGRLIPEKGTSMVLEVLSLVRKRHPEAKLLLVGAFASDAYRREIEERIRREKLTDAVEITGFTKDVSQYFRRADLHLMPSMVEGYPMTLMEAKAHGVPTVSFAMEYLEAAKPQYGCVTVGKLDIAGMARAASELFADRTRLVELGETAFQSLKNFGNEMVYAKWDRLFRSFEDPAAASALFEEPVSLEASERAARVTAAELVYGMSRLPERRYRIPEIEQMVIDNIMARNPVLFYAQKVNRFVESHRPAPGEKGSLLWRGGRFLLLGVVFPCVGAVKRLYRFFVPWRDDGKADWAE